MKKTRPAKAEPESTKNRKSSTGFKSSHRCEARFLYEDRTSSGADLYKHLKKKLSKHIWRNYEKDDCGFESSLILYTIKPHIVCVLSSHCISSCLTLYTLRHYTICTQASYCMHSSHALYTCRSNALSIQASYCIHADLIQYTFWWFRSHTIHMQARYCIDSSLIHPHAVCIQAWYCIHSGLILHTFEPHTAYIQAAYCILTQSSLKLHTFRPRAICIRTSYWIHINPYCIHSSLAPYTFKSHNVYIQASCCMRSSFTRHVFQAQTPNNIQKKYLFKH